jgi:glutamate/tyrosine decarboxylase-like PLP-dependent enzyme
MECVTAALNQSVAVFEMSPVGTVLEHRVIAWMRALAGLPGAAGGTLTSGGTEATFTALLAARAAVMPDAWTNGVGADPPILLCGEHAHYAVTRAGAELGLGLRNVLPIRSVHYKLDPDALRDALRELGRIGKKVMAVVATAGTTATGSFDDLDAIASICDEYGVWLHVDAAHGGSALLSPAHRHRLRGIERARSIAWDPHKMMLLPMQTGMLLVRDERDLEAAFSQRAPYLFQGAEGERGWDQGTRNFMCSRRADVFKLWVAIQRYGASGLGALYDHFCALTRTMWELLAEHPDFEAMHEPEGNILCFRYVGDRTLDDAKLNELNRELRERYNQSGEGWITATNLDGRRVLRVTMMNPRTRASDIHEIIAGLTTVAGELARRG